MGSSTALLVGVGASAGGLEALTALLAGLEASRTQSARIALVVVQHLAPDVDSALPDLLSRHTSLTVRPAADGADWREGGVFVASPGTEVTVVEDHLRVRPFRVPHARVIDALHHSVASTQATGAVVVLSGSGSDGSVGMAACLDAGKYTFVQDPTEAAFDGMPRSALAEVPMAPVLSASQIGETLGRLAAEAATTRTKISQLKKLQKSKGCF
jgi:two-component system CheB/CheR fusion protein